VNAGDRIELRGLRVVGRHGVLPEERERSQPFEVDLDIETDLSQAGEDDDLTLTVDYGAVVQRVADVVADESYLLLEALADAIASAVLAEHGRVQAVTVRLRKLRPPVAHDLGSVAVSIRRTLT
jgi:dihydroneopterin aldolase